jgi:hypothetical protein
MKVHMMIRECLPCKEREEYVAQLRRGGCAFVTERQKNRYIDEFLRFVESTSGHTTAKEIGPSDLREYAKHLEQQRHLFVTARIKMLIPIEWCRWMKATKRIPEDPTMGMSATAMVSDLRASAALIRKTSAGRRADPPNRRARS